MTLDDIYAAYCNLDSRPERNEKMIAELNRVGLVMERQRSYHWKELWDVADEQDLHQFRYMHDVRKTPGAIGCWVSQMAIMVDALDQGKHAWVNEDDLVFCDDIHERLEIIFDFLKDRDWDIFFMGGHYHLEPNWHKSVNGIHTHASMQMCTCTLNRDWEPTDNPHIVRTYGAFSTHSWVINKEKIKGHLKFLSEIMPIAMGIDWAYILQQPKLDCYAFNPGCVKQYSSQSDIGHGISNQEAFRNLGKHWFSRKMNEYIPD